MPDNEKESSPRTDAGLDGMPAADRKETEQILNEIDADAAKSAKPNDNDGKPAEEGKPKPEEKPAPEGKPKEDSKSEKRREVKLIPAFIHETAKSQWEKREKELVDAVEAAKGSAGKKEGDSDDKEPAAATFDAKAIEALAEKHGVTVDFAKDLIELAAKNAGKLPPEVAKQLADVGKFRDEQAIATELLAFNADFDKTIKPLIEAEYGKDVPPDVIQKMRDDLKELAYNPDFEKVPYDVLYKGNEQFRDVVAPIKKGAEGGRGGHTTATDNARGSDGADIDLTQPLGEEQVRSLTDAQFETYEKHMAKREADSRKPQ